MSEVCRWLPKCKGLDNRDPERGAAETFNWVRSVRESRFQDWVRQKQRRPQLELVEELPEEAPEEPPEKHLGREARMRALEAARQGIRQIIREQAPRPYFEQARHLQVGLTLPELNKQLHTFERVRWHQEPTLDVGVSLGESGTRKQIQDRVSQWVKRGGRALMVGAQYAQTQVKDADVREVLENLAKMLAEPLKRRKT
ncbi:hypothetical protein [Hyalangium gracile]|uniref:hypothetical protein n=1 Tax=Hyalangium gracile TaxID=394092 RepID=UPI001CC9D789|nr:hypothetical protein [Hyalangium gracile]